MCKLSIITINYNNAPGLQLTIESVLNQTYKDFEYIIIDGGSSDESVDVIKNFGHRINRWVSEKDNGIYHAMNKGIGVAKGEYLLMLNSGDVLIARETLGKVFLEDVQSDIIYADSVLNDNQKISHHRHPNTLGFNFFRQQCLCHQATFIRRSLHQTVGLYDEKLKVVSDWKFILLAICKHNASFKHLPEYTTQCDMNGFSNSPEGRSQAFAERNITFEEEFAAYKEDYREYDRMQRDLDFLNSKISVRLTRRINRLFRKSP